MIDLHTHSQASDGLDAPEKLAENAVRAGVTVLSLTDHDTVEGIVPLQAAAKRLGIEVIPGVEFDTDFSPGTLHMLGYYVDLNHPGFRSILDRLLEGRERRLVQMLAALKELGMELDEAAVRREAKGRSIGRPHVARQLLANGYVSSAEEAFGRFLAEGRPGYVPRLVETPERAIQRIREAGGVAVLAHPKTLPLNESGLEALLARLSGAGLGGIEVYYPDHRATERRRLLRLARRWNLVPTGGSDYHGELSGRPRLGVGFGNLSVPDEVVDQLQAVSRNR